MLAREINTEKSVLQAPWLFVYLLLLFRCLAQTGLVGTGWNKTKADP
jgi:hypothetical protein